MSISLAVSGLRAKILGTSKGDIAIPSATQNEVDEDDAKMMVDNGIKYVVEGANMPLTAEAIDHIREHRVHYAPGKAANAGGVAVSALEMSQNSVRRTKALSKSIRA